MTVLIYGWGIDGARQWCLAITCKEMYTLEQITEVLENLSDSELLTLWTEYCHDINDSDGEIYAFDDEFFEIFFTDPQECARATFFGDIKSWSDKYIKINAYGNLESGNYLSEMISIYDLASHIEGKQDEYSDLLPELEEEEED